MVSPYKTEQNNLHANSISIFIDSQFPSVFRQEAPLLVKFIKYYYEWLEQYDEAGYIARKIREYRDVDQVPEQFFRFIRSEFMKNIPTTITDERLLIKNILDFYRAKGTEKAYNLLFRIMFGDEDISYYYPGRDILRASDGRWVIERSVTLNLVLPANEVSLLAVVRGSISGAKARIDKFLSYISGGAYTHELYITSIDGTFQVGEVLLDDVSDEPIGTILTFTEYDGKYVGTNGFLSWDKYLQDNFYYQEFSYQINSSRGLSDYRAVATKLTHPAGTKLFGNVQSTTILDLTQIELTNISALAAVGDTQVVSLFYEIVVPMSNAVYPASSVVLAMVDEPEEGADDIDILAAVTTAPLVYWASKPLVALADVPLLYFEQTRWGISDFASFTFPDYTPMVIIDNSPAFEFETYAEVVVNTSMIVLSNVYTPGATTGLTYKYYDL